MCAYHNRDGSLAVADLPVASLSGRSGRALRHAGFGQERHQLCSSQEPGLRWSGECGSAQPHASESIPRRKIALLFTGRMRLCAFFSLYTQLCSEFHVLTAVNKAVMRRADNQMKTKNIYSEIIYNLSPSTNVSCHES